MHSVIISVLTLTVLLSTQVHGEAVTPPNVTDTPPYTNFANVNSTISWGPIPVGTAYKTDTEYDAAGLQPLFDFARSFVTTVQSKPPPFDFIKDAVKGNFKVSEIQSLATGSLIGWCVCIALGILFMIFMPLCGCCFCCCRCCGNCGGRMNQKDEDYKAGACKRLVYGLLLLVCIIFMSVGMICTYVNNDRFTAALKQTKSRVSDSIGDLGRYMNNTIDEIEYVAQTNFNFTRKVIVRDLDNIGVLVGVPVRELLGTEGGVDAAINGIISLDSTISTLSSSLLAVNTSIYDLKGKSSALVSALSTERTNITNTLAACGIPCSSSGIDVSQLNVDFNFDSLDSLDSNMNKMTEVQSQNITALALTGKQQFTDIPDRVSNETKTTVKSMKNMLNTFDGTISNALSSITGLTSSTSMITGVEKDVISGVDFALTYDAYRVYGGIGLTSMVLVIVILMIFGLLFGCLGSSAKDSQYERGCMSNSGGNMLMASTGFMFIFSWLIMLLVVIIFLIGGFMERNICQPLRDKSIFSLLDGPDSLLGGSGYPLGNMLLQNSSINLTFSGILNDCADNKAAYSAMRLDSLFDLSIVTDYKKTINLTAEINNLNTDFSTIEILTPSTEKQLTDFRDGLNIDFAKYTAELSKNATQVDLIGFAESLESLSNTIKSTKSAQAASLNASATNLRSMVNDEVKDVTDAKRNLKDSMNNLEVAVGSVPASVNTTLDNIQRAEGYLKANGSGAVKSTAKAYGNRVIGAADQFADMALSNVKNNLGMCSPVSNIWKSLVEILLCSYVVDALNGFWFSFGWCLFFFIPSIIFSVKLAKHFRKMQRPQEVYEDPEEYPMTDKNVHMNGHAPQYFPDSKVYPQ